MPTTADYITLALPVYTLAFGPNIYVLAGGAITAWVLRHGIPFI